MCVCVFVCVCVFAQVEKTRHYLLLREKLEATLQAGQDVLCKSNDISDFAKSPVLSHSPGGIPPLESPSQRQRELAAKVTTGPWILLGPTHTLQVMSSIHLQLRNASRLYLYLHGMDLRFFT